MEVPVQMVDRIYERDSLSWRSLCVSVSLWWISLTLLRDLRWCPRFASVLWTLTWGSSHELALKQLLSACIFIASGHADVELWGEW